VYKLHRPRVPMLADAREWGVTSAPVLAQPTVFGRKGGQVVGFYHPPDSVRFTGTAVVICNPLGYEAMSAHRSLRHLAEQLAAAGLPVLRFDYRATGDSSGDPGDPGRVKAWVEDICGATHEVRSRSGSQTVALVGLRLGATLATLAAAQEPSVEAVVAWAPVVSGRAFVRELRAFRSMKNPCARRSDGGEEVGGYLFSRETLDDISTIDLLALANTMQGRLLIVTRGVAPARDESDLAARCAAAGLDVGIVRASGYARMMRDDPYDSVVPASALESIVTLLSAQRAQRVYAPSKAEPRSNVVTLDSGSRGGGAVVRETAIRFGEGQRIYGVVTEPETPVAPDRPAILLLNVGADSHVGPHRMHVEHARELASLGYRSLRFDVGGLGESPAAPGESENRLYDLGSVNDVKSAMTALAELRSSRHFVLVGLCSGAFLAYHTAASDPRVVGQVLLNMFAFDWKEGDPVAPFERRSYQSSRSYARSLLDAKVWRRALRGEVDLRGIAFVVAKRLRDRAAADAQDLGSRFLGRRAQTAVEQTFHALCDRGVHSLMVFGDRDGGLDTVARYLGTDAHRMTHREGFAIEIASEIDHTFASIASQQRLRAVVARFLIGHFA
jgi:alpha-beta hydrolase superfamily lysophospholipase